MTNEELCGGDLPRLSEKVRGRGMKAAGHCRSMESASNCVVLLFFVLVVVVVGVRCCSCYCLLTYILYINYDLSRIKQGHSTWRLCP